MPAKKQNIIQEHIEKGVVGLVGLIVLYCIAVYLVGSPVKTELDGQVAKPGEAYSKIAEVANTLDAKAEDTKKYLDVLSMPKVEGGSTTSQPTGLPKSLAKVSVVTPMQNETVRTVTRGKDLPKFDLPKVVSPTKLAVSHGRSRVAVPESAVWADDLKVSDDGLADVSWVTVAGELNLEEQKTLMAGLPDLSAKGPYFIRVDLQRASVNDDGQLGKWENVPQPEEDVLLITTENSEDGLRMVNLQSLREVRDELAKLADADGGDVTALNPEFPPVEAGTEWETPMLAGEKKPAAAEGAAASKKADRASRRETAVGKGGSSKGRGRGDAMGGGPGGGAGGPAMGGGGGGGGGKRGNAGGAGGGAAGGRTAGRGARDVGAGPAAGPMGPAAMGPGAMPMGPGIAPGGKGGADLMGPGAMAMPGAAGMMGPGGKGAAGSGRAVAGGELMRMDDGKALKIWAHDFAAKLGGVYVYRMRVVMYNPLAGWTLHLKNEEDTLLAGLASDWSSPTNPVMIQKDVYYFVKGDLDGRPGAKIEVYKWHEGWLCQKTFNVQVGQAIGSPAMIISYKREGSGLTEVKGEVDFSTDAILVSAQSPVTVTVRDPLGKTGEYETRQENGTRIVVRQKDGTLVSQDTASSREQLDWPIVQEMTASQNKEKKEKPPAKG